MPAPSPQVVVLAGGLGARLGEAGRRRPKVLQPVAGRPFLDLMLEPLVRRDLRRFVFCLGHLAEQVVEHLTGRWPALEAAVHIDEVQRGTAGSLLAARDLLDDVFLVVLGDTYLDIDHRAMLARLTPGVMGVMAVSDVTTDVPFNVDVEGDRVVTYAKDSPDRHGWVDTGALALRGEALDLVAAEPGPVDLAEVFRALIRRGAMAAHPLHCDFYDIGTPERLRRFARFAAGEP